MTQHQAPKRTPFRPVTFLAVIGIVALGTIACGARSDRAQGEVEERSAPAPAALPSPDPLREAVRRNPDDAQAHHALAVLLFQSGRREEALEHFEKVAQLEPSTLRLIELGVAYYSVSRLDDATATFERALELSPDHAVALHHLGNIAEARGNRPEAISLFRRAIASDPDYLIAHYHLAETLKQAGRLEEAYRSYEATVGLEPQGPGDTEAFDGALLQLASLDLQMGATQRAVEFLRVLIEAVPDHPRAHLLLGRALMQLGRQDEARAEFEIHERLAGQASSP